MNTDSQTIRKVLIISARVGAGHVQAAKAIIAQLEQQAPHVEVLHVEAIEQAPWFFRLYYRGGFEVLMTRLGWLYGLGFWLFNRPHRPGRGLFERLRLWWERQWNRRLMRLIADYKPDLIVNTHFVSPPLIERLRKKGKVNCPQIVVCTDIEVHRWWYCADVSHYFVPSEYSAGPPRKWGFAEDRITVSGIPVHPKWALPLDRDAIIRDWKLPADKKIVLLSGGTDFTVGPVVEIARGIVAAHNDAYVVVLAGRNKKLLGDLSQVPETPERMVGMGFTDRVHELVEASTLMVTKPGGVTTAECLAKGCPMVLTRPVPGQEGGNARYLCAKGAAVVVRSPAQIVRTTTELLDSPQRLEEMSAAARSLYIPGTQIICDAICRALGS